MKNRRTGSTGRGLALLLSGLVLVGIAQPLAQSPAPPAPPKAQVEGHSLAAGTIIMWSGPLSRIPAGWLLCDGTKGTPDLTDRFVLGAEDGQEPGEIGGAHDLSLGVHNLPSHDHSYSISSAPAHTHDFNDLVNPAAVFWMLGLPHSGYPIDTLTYTSDLTWPVFDHDHGGSATAQGGGQALDNRPAYHRLAYLMKDEGPGVHFPEGAVLPLARSATSIPAGWRLCDGTLGTPDLRQRFVLSLRPGEQPGEVGGVDSSALQIAHMPNHEHPFSTSFDGVHTHDLDDYWNQPAPGSGQGLILLDLTGSNPTAISHETGLGGGHSHAGSIGTRGSGSSFDNRPAHHNVAFIMRKESRPAAPTPSGAIAMWSGTRASIPAGWRECDGKRASPDLRDRFMRGSTKTVGTAGAHQLILGESQLPKHAHSFQLDQDGDHAHHLSDKTWGLLPDGTGGLIPQMRAFSPPTVLPSTTGSAGAHDHSSGSTISVGSGQPFDNRPAYYRMIFIVKL